MKIAIECEPKEIAALVVALQERPIEWSGKELADAIIHQLSADQTRAGYQL